MFHTIKLFIVATVITFGLVVTKASADEAASVITVPSCLFPLA